VPLWCSFRTCAYMVEVLYAPPRHKDTKKERNLGTVRSFLFMPEILLMSVVCPGNDIQNKTHNCAINKKNPLCLSVFVVFFPDLCRYGRGVLSTTKAQKHKERKEFWDRPVFPLRLRDLFGAARDAVQIMGIIKPITTSQNKKKTLCLGAFVVFFPDLCRYGRGVLSTTKARRHKEREKFCLLPSSCQRSS
jgi:hypothetical protein